MKRKISAARLELIADRNGDIVWERRVPLMKETLGISQRAELARQAMASPINHSPRLPAPALADFDDLAAMPGWAKTVYLVCALLVLAGIGFLAWASV